jgi:hypothetical protein
VLVCARRDEAVEGARPAGDIEYIFKHALTQEVAYNALLVERRKLLHERAGVALESMFAEQLDDHLDELAHHYSRGDNTAKAVEYLGRAGLQTLQRSAHADAINSLTAALDLLRRLPDRPERIHKELPLQLGLGRALFAVKGFAAAEAERAFTRARELCEKLGDLAHFHFGPPGRCVARFALAGNALDRAALAPTSAGMIFRLRTEVQGIVAAVPHGGRGEPSAWSTPVSDLARLEGIDGRSVRRLIPLGFLSPRIIEAIAEGRQPVELTVEALTRRTDLPLLWSAQRQALGIE